MIYLLTAFDLNPQTRRWLNNYAIKLSRDTWLHNTTAPGCVKATLSAKTANEMRKCVLTYAIPWIDQVHDMIMNDRLNRKDLRLIQNKLRMMHSVLEENLSEMEDILLQLASYLDVFSEVLGEEEEKTEPKDTNENNALLGVEGDSVQNYLLSLVNKETIH